MKITAVSYLNTKPLLYGIFKSKINEKITLELNIPSVCADKLANGEVDLGLVPVAVIPKLPAAHIVSDYCIGTVGAVKTVGIYSNCPIEEMTHVFMDYHSRTSVQLAQILFRDYWHIQPELLTAQPGFEDKIEFTRGALIIGDRTIGLDKKYPYFYDLGAAWLEMTGLPFVFAAWVSTKPLEESFLKEFNAALKMGIDEIPQLMYILPRPSDSDFDLELYFTKYISYEFDAEKQKALDLFLKLCKC